MNAINGTGETVEARVTLEPGESLRDAVARAVEIGHENGAIVEEVCKLLGLEPEETAQ